jgi:hypothetical protein
MNIFRKKIIDLIMKDESNIKDVTTRDDKDSKDAEGKLQAECYQWFNNTFPHLRGLLYHVPNGEKREPITANLLKAKGVVAGIPDLVFHYRSRTYFLELKKPDGTGVLSKAQKNIHKQLDTQRFIVWILNDFETFKYLIECIVNDTSHQFTFGLTKENYYYKHKIFEYIYSLGDCEVVKISDVCEEHNRGKFVNYVTEFIVEGYAVLDGFELLFTPDYKAFYKKVLGSANTINYES